MKASLFVSHGVIFVCELGELVPGSDWTEAHGRQGFARRRNAASILTIVEYGPANVGVASEAEALECDDVVAISVLAQAGAIGVCSVDPTDVNVWQGPPGWVRVTLGQRMSADHTVLDPGACGVRRARVGRERDARPAPRRMAAWAVRRERRAHSILAAARRLWSSLQRLLGDALRQTGTGLRRKEGRRRVDPGSRL
jgi:hypothetical protein